MTKPSSVIISVLALLAILITSPVPAQAQYEKIVETARPAVVLIAVETEKGIGTGSGFIIGPSGYIVTARHVVEDAKQITVFLPDGRQMSAAVVRYSTIFDAAVIKLEGFGFPALRFGDSDVVRQGQEVLVLGYPFATSLGRESVTVTRGIISAIRTSEGVLQIDAALNPGNSGGPVLNLRGEVIGVAVARLREGQAINFAVAGNLARSLTGQLTSTPIEPPKSSDTRQVQSVPPAAINHPFWPFSEGARWEYGTNEAPTGKRGRLMRILTAVETRDDRVSMTENYSTDGESWSSRFFVTGRGVYQDSVKPNDGVTRFTIPSPNMILPFPVNEGTSWETSYIEEDRDGTVFTKETRRVARVGTSYTTPAGTFQNCVQVLGSEDGLVTQQSGSQRFVTITERVYCSEAGLVFSRRREVNGQFSSEQILTWFLIPR